MGKYFYYHYCTATNSTAVVETGRERTVSNMLDLILLVICGCVMGWTACMAGHPVRLYLRLRRLRIYRKRPRNVIPFPNRQ